MFANIRAGSRNYIYASCEFENPVEKAYMIFRQDIRVIKTLTSNIVNKKKGNTIYCGKFDSIQFLDTAYI